MSSGTVEQIKSKLGIVEVVGMYLRLEKAGTNYKAKCPFHQEKSPSFFVSPARGSYYCFGCQAKGDIFSFIQEFEGVDFMGALKTLAERAGVPLEFEKPEAKSERDRLLSAMEHAALHFQKNLGAANDALLYLKKRGLKIETVRAWRIGFAPVAWTNLREFLAGKGFNDGEMEKAGLIKRADDDRSRFYDRFRGRIMFPIFDSSGRVIAFSGRILVDDGVAAKYLNSPETPLFHKSEVLYGFDRAKLEIKKADKAVIVEGQMDLLMSHQAGIANTVAVSGTALTPQHLAMIKRLAPSVVLAFDADGAGFNAALKSAEAALSMGMEVKAVEIEGGKDPADLVLADPELWKKSLAEAKHIVLFVLSRVMKGKADQLELLREIRAKVLPYVARIESPIEQAHFVQTVAHMGGVREDALWEELKKMPKIAPESTHAAGASAGGTVSVRKPVQTTHGSQSASTPLRLFGLIFAQERSPGEGGKAKAAPAFDPAGAERSLAKTLGEKSFAEAKAEAESKRNELVFEAELLYDKPEKANEAKDDLLRSLEEDRLKKLLTDAMQELQNAEHRKDKAKISEMIKRCQELSEAVRDLNARK